MFVEPLEARCLLNCSFDAYYRSYDGTCNNFVHPDWGSAGVGLLRTAPAAYADGISAPVVGNPARPSPRAISNAVVAQEDDVPDRRFMAAMIYAFGQFLDHDLDLTKPGSPSVPFNIPVPRGDPFFDPLGTGTQVIRLNRSAAVPGTGTSTSNPRQQPNLISAFIDASVVYGSDAATARQLRTLVGGRLKTSPGDHLPFNNSTYFAGCAPETPCLPMDNDARRVPDTELFAAGDVRANENIELSSLHTLFVREHNRLADRFTQMFPWLGDEGVYQLARHYVAAELQVITYKEWIPKVFGPNALPAYRGYNPNVNPGVANEFSTALFRVGHTMLGDDVEFLDNDGEEVHKEVPLSEAFSNPPLLLETGIGPILKYLASDPAQTVDSMIMNSVRNFLFGEPGQGGFDLASLNMQRGRDHGLADYNTLRAAYGLPRVAGFAQITSDPELRDALRELYGNVNNIDAWIGGISEDHVPGTSTGPLIRRVVLDQFRRSRDGDRFWYQNFFSGLLLAELENTTLKDVLARNTEIDNLQGNVFEFRLSVTGVVFNDRNRNGRRDQGEEGLAGRTVRLIDEETNEEVGRTRTGANGSYRFDNLDDGLEFGTYLVRQVVPNGWVQTTRNPDDVALTRGRDVTGVNFGTARHGRSPGLGDDGAPDAFAAAVLAPTAAAPIPQVTIAPAVREFGSATPAGQSVGIAEEASTARDMNPVAGLEPLETAAWAESLQTTIWATDEIFARP